jgi:hypothetical protein
MLKTRTKVKTGHASSNMTTASRQLARKYMTLPQWQHQKSGWAAQSARLLHPAAMRKISA